MPPSTTQTRDVLALTLIPGLGPMLVARLLHALGDAKAVLNASHAQLIQIPRLGDKTAREIIAARRDVDQRVDEELDAVEQAGARIVAIHEDEYPALLRSIPDPPPLLYVRGRFDHQADQYPIAIVGSRKCSHYGVEQSERFGGILARAGLTIISGGARGIDTAAHRGALRHGGRTIAVLGCGLSSPYPPENRELFDQIVAEDLGAIVSELPMRTSPESKNFPSRNRIISGMSLGVLVIEAGLKSGALITARLAAEDHNRDVMALPGRVDAEASRGSNDLIKSGGAALVTEPADVIAVLESAARHAHFGTHEVRFATGRNDAEPSLLVEPPPQAAPLVSEAQRKILDAIGDGATPDQISDATGIPPGQLRAEITLLEVAGRVRRMGGLLTAAKSR